MAPAQTFDIAIVGAGAVGGTLAYALAEVGYRVALVEKTAVSATQQPAFDERHLGFSRSTKIALEGLGLWQNLAAQAIDIKQIHISSRGCFGSVMMDASDEGLDALGYVLPAREIGRVLHEAIEQQSEIQVFAPAELISANTDQDAATLVIEQDGQSVTIKVDLLVGADGVQSQVRGLFGIDTIRWEYGQSAVIANVDVPDLRQSLAYERFIDQGAIALLPRNELGYAAVCSVANDQADQLMAMDDGAFAAYLMSCFGSRLPLITRVGQRHRFPLALVRTTEVVRDRLVLIGNAAHFIHPVAAQGFNLSMRDVAALVEVLVKARHSGQQPGDIQALSEYARWRKNDERIMVAFTDGLIRLFTNPLLPVAMLRQNGLLMLRYFPGLRRLFTRVVTGRIGKQAALMRGAGL